MEINLILSIIGATILSHLGNRLFRRLTASWPKVEGLLGRDPLIAFWPLFLVLLMVFKPFFPA